MKILEPHPQSLVQLHNTINPKYRVQKNSPFHITIKNLLNKEFENDYFTPVKKHYNLDFSLQIRTNFVF